jgi:RNA polymerase sigma-70 factor, ECF subfamily
MTPARLPLSLAMAGAPPTREAAPAAPAADRLTTLFHDHFDLVWRTVRRLGVPPEAVDDAAQEVFVIASRRLASIAHGKERAFLYGTAVRVASTARRTSSRRREAAPPEDGLDPADTAPAADDTRPVFVLYELEGLTMEEIAGCLEVPPGTVASRLRRARELFQAAVARIDRGAARKEARRG